MPKLACRSCGRQIYTAAPIDSLFQEERRCPRCGAVLFEERRGPDRRKGERRKDPAQGPPPGMPERRSGRDRRRGPRRSGEARGWTGG